MDRYRVVIGDVGVLVTLLLQRMFVVHSHPLLIDFSSTFHRRFSDGSSTFPGLFLDFASACTSAFL